MDLEFKPVSRESCALGEGPIYDDRRDALWYCDIVGRAIHRINLADGAERKWDFPSEVGSIGMTDKGRLVVALRHEVGIFDPDDGSFRRLATIEADTDRETRLNDGKVGPDGAFWVGTMDDRGLPEREPLGSLYRVDGKGNVERKIPDLRVSNGLAFSPDGKTMFHSDFERQMDRPLVVRSGDRRHHQPHPHRRARRCHRPPRWRRHRCRGLLLERRRLGCPAQPLLARGQTGRELPRAGGGSDDAVLRRARPEEAVRDEP